MEQNRFWKEQAEGDWPTDPPGWLFLGRAALHLADKMHHDAGLCFRPRPDLELALALMKERGEQLSPENVEFIRADFKESAPRDAQRVRAVQEQIRRWAEGPPYLRTGTRPTKGGAEVRPLPAIAWSSQSLSSWFYRCEMNPRQPSSTAISGDKFEHVFVDREQFLALVRIEIEKAAQDGDAVRAGLAAPASGEAGAAPAMLSTKDKGGKPLDSEKWGNLVGVLVAFFKYRELEPEITKGRLYMQLANYADTIGAPIPAKTTALPALDRALRWAQQEHNAAGDPLQDLDGNPLRD